MDSVLCFHCTENVPNRDLKTKVQQRVKKLSNLGKRYKKVHLKRNCALCFLPLTYDEGHEACNFPSTSWSPAPQTHDLNS